MIQRWDDLTEAEQKRILKAQLADVDDEDMTYERVQYAQVGQAHSLSDEVRELRKKVQELEAKVDMQRNMIIYWQNTYNILTYAVAEVLTLYGWGYDAMRCPPDALGRVRRDILSLRQRVHDLKVPAKYAQSWAAYWERVSSDHKE